MNPNSTQGSIQRSNHMNCAKIEFACFGDKAGLN